MVAYLVDCLLASPPYPHLPIYFLAFLQSVIVFPVCYFLVCFSFCTSNIFLLSNYSVSLFTLFFIVLFYLYSFVCFVVVLRMLVARPWWITCRQPFCGWYVVLVVGRVRVVCRCGVPVVPGDGCLSSLLFCFVSVSCGAVDVPFRVTPCRAVSHIVSCGSCCRSVSGRFLLPCRFL